MKYESQKLLEKISTLDEHIEQLKFELSELEKSRVSIRAVNYDPHGSGSAKNEAAFEKTVDKITDLELAINREIEALAQLRYNAIRLIQRLENPKQSQILFMRYVQRKSFDEIIASIGYAPTYIYTMHRTALAELDKITAKASSL